MTLSIHELKTLLNLKKSSSGLDAFSLFNRLSIPFTDYTKVIKSLLEYELIFELKSDYFRISKSGEEHLIRQSTISAEKHWRNVPEKYLKAKLKKGAFYVPSIRLLDKKAFKIKGSEVE